MAPIHRRALLVGIDHYQLPGHDLLAPVADASALEDLLRTNQDGTPNYDCRTLRDQLDDGSPITRAALRQEVRVLFDDFVGEVLFFFSGHGVLSDTGGVLATADAAPDDWGVPMEELAQLARQSKATDILMILDCCNSGDMSNAPSAGRGPTGNPFALLRDNMTVIAASTPQGSAVEAGGISAFTAAVCDALEGGAADHMGLVSPPSIYAYVERRFGAWEQRPVFRTNATRVPSVRRCAPLVDRLKLVRLVELFPTPDHVFLLDPEFEPEDEFGNLHEPVSDGKVEIAGLLKEFRDAGLVTASVPGEQFFWVARRSHGVLLTNRGREYRGLVATGRL